VFHGDAALVAESLDVLDDTGTRLAADVGFEAAGCCGLGLYAAQTSRTTGQAKHDNAETVIDGGLELNLAPRIGSLQDRLRMRLRAGKAGTPPYLESAGRSGFSASAGLIFRLWDTDPPPVNYASPDIDVLLEYYGWSLGKEQTSAGPREEGNKLSDGAILLGFRLGLDYGVELK
jgi:hypothetical protein